MRITIGTRIGGGFGVLLLMVAGVGGLAYVSLTQAESSLSDSGQGLAKRYRCRFRNMANGSERAGSIGASAPRVTTSGPVRPSRPRRRSARGIDRPKAC